MSELLETEEAPKAAADDVEAPYGMAGNKAMTGGHAQTATQDLKSDAPTDLNNPTGFDTRFASELNQQMNFVKLLFVTYRIFHLVNYHLK